MLTRQAILEAKDQTIQEVQVPEWGGSLYIRTLTGAERDAFEKNWIDAQNTGNPNFRAKLAARVICGQDGKRVFSDNDIAALGEKSGAALSRVFEAAMKINFMTAADVEELEKNSDGGQSADSSSA